VCFILIATVMYFCRFTGQFSENPWPHQNKIQDVDTLYLSCDIVRDRTDTQHMSSCRLVSFFFSFWVFKVVCLQKGKLFYRDKFIKVFSNQIESDQLKLFGINLNPS
jgi:hypothetical protein